MYTLTISNGTNTREYTCAKLLHVLDYIAAIYGNAINPVHVIQSAALGLEHIACVRGEWITVTPLRH
jgi:hypothetical protein